KRNALFTTQALLLRLYVAARAEPDGSEMPVSARYTKRICRPYASPADDLEESLWKRKLPSCRTDSNYPVSCTLRTVSVLVSVDQHLSCCTGSAATKTATVKALWPSNLPSGAM